jgi:hypothetical protein
MKRTLTALALALAATTLAPAHATAAPSQRTHGVIYHLSPDRGYDGGFRVRCRDNGQMVTIKEGQDSRDKCPGTGKVDQLQVKARQSLTCYINGTPFVNLFRAGQTYLIASAQGPYRCVSRRP